jgi:hypothetical protein
MEKIKSHVYVLTDEHHRGIERKFTPVDPGEKWLKLDREQNDLTRTRFESFKYFPDGTIEKIPEVEIVVSGIRVEVGQEFSVYVKAKGDLGEKETVGINVSGTHYDLEPSEDLIIIEAESGVYTIMLEDPEVWAEQTSFSVMTLLPESGEEG